MIHKTNFQTGNALQSGSKGISPEDLKLLLAKYAQELLSKLQKGDVVQGKILKDENQQYSLFLKQGGKIPISLIADAEMGKEITLIVEKNENGKVTLRPLEQAGESIVGKVIDKLHLPNTPEMKNWIDTFIDKNFPLEKEVLVQSHYLEKNFKLPKEVITHFLENTGALDPGALENVGTLKSGGLFNLIHQVKQLVQQINTPQVLEQITNMLQQTQSSVMQEGILQQETLMQQQKISSEEEFSKQNLSKQDTLNPNKSMDFQYTKEELYSFVQQKKERIYQLMDKKLFFDPLAYQKMSKEEQHESTKAFTNIYKNLASIVNLVEEDSLSAEGKQVLTGVREDIMSLGKVNHEANYFIFPMMQKDQEVQAEVYFFKPKKTAKKRDSQVYAVVALDLAELKHIEIHVRKQEKVLELAIHTENREMQKHIIKHMPNLQEVLETLGYAVSQCSYHLFQDKKIQKEPKDMKDILRSLDLKA